MKVRIQLFRQVWFVLFFFILLSRVAFVQGESGYIREAIDLETQDGLNLLAIKYSNGANNARWGAVIMHPAGDMRRDWRLPYFARAGIVGIGMAIQNFWLMGILSLGQKNIC